MKKIFSALLILLLSPSVSLFAQQEAQYTQWMFNKLSINPGFAVSEGDANISLLHRSQWLGFEGAPENQSFNFRMPFEKRNMGLGLSINHDRIGPTNSWTGSGIYAYKLRMANDKYLGIGLQGTLRSYQVRYSETEALDNGDGRLPTTDQSRILPNFGLGLYYYTPKYYVGFSVPKLLQSNLSFYKDLLANSDYSQEETHAFLMAGIVLELNEAMKLKPSLLFKYATNSPLDIDIHSSLILYDAFWVGLTYRLGGISNVIGESLDLVLQMQIQRKLRIGFAYDFTLSKIRNYNDGTFELVLDYSINNSKGNVTNPRYF